MLPRRRNRSRRSSPARACGPQRAPQTSRSAISRRTCDVADNGARCARLARGPAFRLGDVAVRVKSCPCARAVVKTTRADDVDRRHRREHAREARSCPKTSHLRSRAGGAEERGRRPAETRVCRSSTDPGGLGLGPRAGHTLPRRSAPPPGCSRPSRANRPRSRQKRETTLPERVSREKRARTSNLAELSRSWRVPTPYTTARHAGRITRCRVALRSGNTIPAACAAQRCERALRGLLPADLRECEARIFACGLLWRPAHISSSPEPEARQRPRRADFRKQGKRVFRKS